MTQRIIQFGTSRFLQAHADLFIHEARQQGQDIGPITVVKTTTGAERQARIAGFNANSSYPIIIRGLINKQAVEETIKVSSIDQALIAERDWLELTKLFAHEAKLIISNVGESGYALAPDDIAVIPNQAPKSFPAKLLALLHARYLTTAAPLLILPCELISNNGQVLRQIIEGLVEKWRLDDGFKKYLKSDITICDTLVDRIVSEAIEPVGAIAEPYALWAIKRAPDTEIPFTHKSVIVTDDLEPFIRLKLHILNLGHSFLAEIWQAEKRSAQETVREILAVSDIKHRLTSLYQREIIPGFAAHNKEKAAQDYVATTLERFENPYLNHRLSDIAQNHNLKIQRRVVDFINWVKLRRPNAVLTSLEDWARLMNLRYSEIRV